MNPELCRTVARAMGKAQPAPTLEDRQKVLKALELAEEWQELPRSIRKMLGRFRNSARSTTRRES